MPLRGGGGRGLRRLVPSSHERSESRHKIILHLDSLQLREEATLGQTYKCAVMLIPISPELSKHDP